MATAKLGKPRWRTVLILRRLFICAIGSIALMVLLSVHVHEVSKLPFDAAHKFSTAHETEYQKLSSEQSYSHEFAASHLLKVPVTANKPQMTAYQKPSSNQSYLHEHALSNLLKAPVTAHKLDGGRRISEADLWKRIPDKGYIPCTKPNSSYQSPSESRGYLLVHTNGGLNQMRAGICDMVAVARMINATLVIPELDKRSFWHDSSNFSDVFDESHFINSLKDDVRIIKKLPKELSSVPKAVKHFTSWSGKDYYEEEIAAMWEEFQVIRAEKSDSRLANNNLPPDIQKLRCRACYEALRFAPEIERMGKLLVDRMRSYGRYISLHLRFEKDMLAFSGCTQDLSPEEVEELKVIREQTIWWKVKDIDPLEQRARGYCLLTPKEVGIFLQALGFPSSTPIYIAAGEIYGGESRMADLQKRYPILMNKDRLTSTEELEPFTSHASQMAALDYIVSVESDIFIPTYSGNMAMAVEGHRRFLGHRKTISPDRKGLVRLFDKISRGTMKEGKNLSNRVIFMHKRRQGSPRKRKGPVPGTRGKDRFRSEEAFYVNPLPECLCQNESFPNNISLVQSE